MPLGGCAVVSSSSYSFDSGNNERGVRCSSSFSHSSHEHSLGQKKKTSKRDSRLKESSCVVSFDLSVSPWLLSIHPLLPLDISSSRSLCTVSVHTKPGSPSLGSLQRIVHFITVMKFVCRPFGLQCTYTITGMHSKLITFPLFFSPALSRA